LSRSVKWIEFFKNIINNRFDNFDFDFYSYLQLIPMMSNKSKDGLKPTSVTHKEYTVSIWVHIPFSSLSDNICKYDYKSVAKSTATKTETRIQCYQLLHLSQIRFCVFGKWRKCLLADRLLWFQLIGDTTIYTHLDWAQELDKPMTDQKGIPFRHLYRNFKYESLNEFKVLSICGICWDVLKVRKELIRRKSIQCNQNQSINTKREIIALQILKCIRAHIRDHILHTPDSIYFFRKIPDF
jgi:hypothetical protein